MNRISLKIGGVRMNLFKSLKNRKGAIGAIGAISIGILILTLAFAIASVSYMIPTLAEITSHNATVTLTPDVANCDTIPDIFIVHIHNDEGYGIYNVKIYKAMTNVIDLTCGEAPSGWTTTGILEYGLYCEYKTDPKGSDVIEAGEELDFHFEAIVEQVECISTFRITTLDNEAIVTGKGVGEEENHFNDLKVDCVNPTLSKDVGEPKLPGTGFDWWVTKDTLISLTATDNTNVCDLGIDYCDWQVTIDGVPQGWNTEEDGEILTWNLPPFIDSNHYLEVECYDKAGNEVTLTENDKADSTPPETTKTITPEPYIRDGVEFIDHVNQIELTAEDGGDICAIGVDKIWYMNVIDLTERACWDPEEYCNPLEFPTPYTNGVECINEAQVYCDKYWEIDHYDNWEKCVEDMAHEECRVDPLWKLYDGTPIQKMEESCHVLQYFSVDNIGNIERMNVNCFFVDLTPPRMIKEVGQPNVPCIEGECREFDYWVSQQTPITLDCIDQEPHPSGDEKVCYRISFDGDPEWLTDKYCDEFGGRMTGDSIDAWCCDSVADVPDLVTTEMPRTVYNFTFQEDSVHDLEFYCEDAVGKKTEPDVEYFKVDSIPPSITKTMIGTDHLGDCPPEPTPLLTSIEPCYVRDDGENGVHIAVEDGGEICAVDQSTCQYELWWQTDLDTCVKEFEGTHLYNPDTGQCFVEGGQFGEEGKDVIFHEDSTHILKVNCKDALGNEMLEDVETFLVDSTPPVTLKTYGSPTKVVENDFTHRWITSDTDITLDATDAKVGVEKIKWGVTQIIGEDELCYEECRELFDEYGGEDLTEEVTGDTATFKIGEDSCHLIEFYAIDRLGNEEVRQWQCIFVDNKEPKEIKIVGEPNVPIKGGDSCGTVTGDLDVLFLFDLTGSMGGVIDSAKANAIDIMDDIQALVPDAQFGTGSFRDYPDDYNYCGYDDTYGGGGDYPWSLDKDITSDKSAVSTAIGIYYASGGSDGPESYARALYESQSVGWRTGSRKIVIIFEDSVPHDCDMASYVGTDCWYDFSTGTDPGRDATAGNSDDITWANAVADLKDTGISVIVVDSGDAGYSCPDVWKYASDQTGGLYTTLGSDFTKTIVDSVTEVIGCKDWWVRDKVTPITLDCDDSWVGKAPHPVGQETLCYRISFDDTTTPYLTEDYCRMFGGEMTGDSIDAWCCAYVGEPTIDVVRPSVYNFTFQEDSVHDLEFYCKDHLGNTGETDTEIFKVDSVAPETEKTYVGPYYVDGEGNEFIDTDTTVKLEAEDGGDVCAVGVDVIQYRVSTALADRFCYNCEDWMTSLRPDIGPWNNYTEPFPITEESCHVIEFRSIDKLGNTEEIDWQCVFVDKTKPETTKTYGEPFYADEGGEWITPDTPITLTVEDLGPHKSGIKETKYRVERIDDVYCNKLLDTYCAKEITAAWQTYTVPFKIGEQSCHKIEYYSVDNVGKTETVKSQCVYVENTPPEVTKIISEPYEEWEGDDTFYPGLKARCAAGEIDCWKVTLGNVLSITCTDPEPHPVDHNKICFQIELDGDDVTEEYCRIYGVYNESGDGYCCRTKPLENFQFAEESQHDLKVKCVDALGNEGKIDEEKFKVEGCTYELCLKKKWNLISIPFTLFNDDPDVVFEDIKDNVASIWTYDYDGWSTWVPGKDGTLKHIKPGYGYWVLAKEDTCVEIAGSLFVPLEVPPSRDLQDGWNLIGYYGNTIMPRGLTIEVDGDGRCMIPSKPVYCALNSLVDTQQGFPRWSSLYNYFNNGYIDGHEDAGWIGLDACIDERWTAFMEAGKGYWIEMDVKDSYAPATNCIWNEDMSCVMPFA